MKNNKLLFLVIFSASILLANSLFAQNKFAEKYKDIHKALKGSTAGSAKSRLDPKQVTTMLLMAVKVNDGYEQLNSVFKNQVLPNKDRDIIVSDAVKKLFDSEDYDAFLYLYDLAQKDGKVKITAKTKTNILENIVFMAQEFKKDDLFELLNGTLKYLSPKEIRDNFSSSLLFVNNLSLDGQSRIILDVALEILKKAESPNNLRVSYDPETNRPTTSPNKRISLLSYMVLKYDPKSSIHKGKNNKDLFTMLIINYPDKNEKIGNEYLWQIVNNGKLPKEIKDLFNEL